MSQLFVPDETFLVCSSGMHVQKLKVSSQQTIKIDGVRLGATIDDRTGSNFICAKMVIAGAVAGAIAAAVIVATGGAALGLGAALAAGVAVGAGAGLAASFAMPCLCALFTMPNDWAPVHPKVKFVGKKPLIETSKLPCVLGGVVSIYYSEEAADAQAAYNRANTIFTVGAMAATLYLGGVLIASLGTAASSVAATYGSYGLLAAAYEAIGGVAVFGGAYAVNSGYDWVKQNATVNGHSIDSYVTGEKYEEEFNDKANRNKNDIDAENKELGYYTSSEADAMGRGTDAIKDINKEQISKVTLTNTSATTYSLNKVFLANSNGEILAPGNTQIIGQENSVLSSEPVSNPIYNKDGGKITGGSISAEQVETPNLVNTRVAESVTTSTSQFDASLPKTLAEGFKGYGKSTFNLTKTDFYKTGFGMVLFIDAARAAGNWVLAKQIEGIQEAASKEAEEKSKLNVKENEI
jgi:hypothetical protein